MIRGYLILDKPAGITSSKAVEKLRKILGTTKVGHTGTLDRFATGVLPVLAGSYTRLLQYFTAQDKEYEAVFTFGATTATLDPEGEVTATAEIPSPEALARALIAFRGDIMQVPPEYSAIHINGKRAYEYVLAGEKPEMKPRPVTIKELELLDYSGGKARVRVACSKGTYIRSLARDIALEAGSVAHVSELRRTASGAFGISSAITLENVSPGRLRPLLPEDAFALGMDAATLKPARKDDFRHGRPLDPDSFQDFPVAVGNKATGKEEAVSFLVFSPAGILSGVMSARSRESGRLSLGYEAVFPDDAASPDNGRATENEVGEGARARLSP